MKENSKGNYFFKPSYYEKAGEAPVPDNRSYEEWLSKNPEIYESFKSYILNVGDTSIKEIFTIIEDAYDIIIPDSIKNDFVEAIRVDTKKYFIPYPTDN